MKENAYLFAHELTTAGCLSLRLDSSGLIHAPLGQRTFDELISWQENASFTLVLPAQQFSFHRVELPKLSEKKAREALPYALEHQLAADIENLFFIIDNQYYQANHYLVAVCDQTYLENTFGLFQEQKLQIIKTTIDCFAVPLHEFWRTPQGLLINNDPHFIGFLNPNMLPEDKHGLRNDPLMRSLTNPEIFYQQLAISFQTQSGLNLGRGNFGSSRHSHLRPWLQRAAAMSGLCLLVFLLTHGIRVYQLVQQTKVIDGRIATLYHQLFPQSTQIINPRFRVQQLIKTNQQESIAWFLLNKLAENVNEQIKIKQIRFQNDKIQLAFLAQSFSSLESFTHNLQSAPLHVKQEQANSTGTGVEGHLELSL